jgi:hypothetical protein
VIEADDQIAFRRGQHWHQDHPRDPKSIFASDEVREATDELPGVDVETGRVVLLENERDEWELPGVRLEPGAAPETCLVRKFAEGLGEVVEVARIIDCWLCEVLPKREVAAIRISGQ